MVGCGGKGGLRMKQTGAQRLARILRWLVLAALAAICQALDCQPGDILEFVPDEEGEG
ncbi:hypothetical protein B5E43_04020 [Flavonifractor sp. An100]|nr:hypothetical protein B5E43_04020 [Flavonifractor sp. An100]